MEIKKREKLQIAVLFGGDSTEHEVSLFSSKNIIRALDRKKYNLILIGIDKRGRWMLCNEKDYLFNSNDISFISLIPTKRYLAIIPGKQGHNLIEIANGRSLPPIDVVFSVLHGTHGEDGSIQGLLRMLNLPHIGTGVLGSAICMDKDMTKRILRDAGLPVIPSITLLRTNASAFNFDVLVDKLGIPLFIKPANQGSSVGISKVDNKQDFSKALDIAFRYDTKIVVEQAIIGREIEIAVLGNDIPEVSVCGEIITNDEFYTYDLKYMNDSQVKLSVPAILTPSLVNAIQKIAQQAYLVLSCNVMARIDLFLTKHEEILLNEVNTLPGFTSVSMFPRLWEASGLHYSALIDRLITLAQEHKVR